jgi:hypothetical protein
MGGPNLRPCGTRAFIYVQEILGNLHVSVSHAIHGRDLASFADNVFFAIITSSLT